MKLFVIAAISVLLFPAVCLSQAVLFDEDFESDLSSWGVLGHGVLVADPLAPSNQVLSFTQTNAGGDMWSIPLAVDLSSTYVLSFRYLGNAGGEDTGGYLWLWDPEQGYPVVSPTWGTQPENSQFELIDDGAWHLYQHEFTIAEIFDSSSGYIQVVVEDWNGSAGVNPPPNIAGDAFFDDIQIYELGAVENEAASWGGIKTLFR